MAIAYDNSTAGVGSANPTLTFSHTCTGSNLILFVGIQTYLNSADAVTSVKYAGSSLTRIDDVAGDGHGYFYYMVNPATGANNVVITVTSNRYVQAVASSYTGAAQTGQPDAHGFASGSASTSDTKSITSIADNCWHVGHQWQDTGGANTAGANTTKRAENNSSAAIDSNSAKTPAGALSLNCSWGSSGKYMIFVATVAPVPSANHNPDFFSFF